MSCILMKEMLVPLPTFGLHTHRFAYTDIMAYTELKLSLTCAHQSFAYAAPFQAAFS